jgi:hypothetical protein
MKTIFTLIFLTIETNVLALDTEVMPILAVGHRMGNGNINNKGATYASAKLNLVKSDLADFRTLNLMSLGVNYQDDKKWVLSVSPISVTSMTGLTVGVDLMMTEKNVNGGTVGLFLAYKFH